MVAFLKRIDSGLATGVSRQASRASDFQIMGASRLCRGRAGVHEKGRYRPEGSFRDEESDNDIKARRKRSTEANGGKEG